MIKIHLILIILASYISVLNAQESDKTLGLILGYPNEISFQTGLSSATRLELGLGLRTYSYGNFSFSGVHQWLWSLSSILVRFNCYAGVGGRLEAFSDCNKSYFPLSVFGQLGIEYKFKIPITVSLDYRPTILLTGKYAGQGAFVGDGFCLGLRYRL